MLSKDTRLLRHPVVLMLLDKKLKQFGWLLYYLNLLMYLLLVSLLMAFIILLPNPNSIKCELLEKQISLTPLCFVFRLGLEASNTSSLESNMSTNNCSGMLVF